MKYVHSYIVHIGLEKVLCASVVSIYDNVPDFFLEVFNADVVKYSSVENLALIAAALTTGN